jgi:hypothetical protein
MKREAPERIYGWLNSHLSIARFYGGIAFNGSSYYISPKEEGQPLVRADVLKREAKEKRRKVEKAKEEPTP